MIERLEIPAWQKLSPFLVGVAYAVYTTLPVLNPASSFWLNDEARFLAAGRTDFDLDIRYGLFGLLVKSYYLFTADPFSIVLLHKLVVLCAFLAVFQGRVLTNNGGTIFVLTFSAFLYLNGYFLRDSIVYFFTQLAVVFALSFWTVRGVAGFVPLILLRPQNLLLFIPSWMSVLLIGGFLIPFRYRYAELQLQDQSYWAIFDKAIWLKGLGSIVTTVSNLNPLIKLPFFFERGLYADYLLLLLGCVGLFAVFIYLGLSFYCLELRFLGWDRVCVGLGCILVMYGALVVVADIRIFFAAVCPFALRIRGSLLNWKMLSGIVLIWLSMTLIRYCFDS